MPNHFVEGGRAPAIPPQQLPPEVKDRPPALIVIREVPRPNQIEVPYYMAVSAEPPMQGGPTFDIETLPGAPKLVVGPPILYVFSGCLATCAIEAMQKSTMFGWNPQPHPQSVIPVAQALRVPPKRPDQEPPFQTFLDHIKLILSGGLEDVNIPPILRLVGNSGRPFIPCGTGVSHNGPCLGDPCPTGPCHLNKGGPCVWAKRNLSPERHAELVAATESFRKEKAGRLAAMKAGQQVPQGNPMQIPAPPGAMAPALPGGIPGQQQPGAPVPQAAPLWNGTAPQQQPVMPQPGNAQPNWQQARQAAGAPTQPWQGVPPHGAPPQGAWPQQPPQGVPPQGWPQQPPHGAPPQGAWPQQPPQGWQQQPTQTVPPHGVPPQGWQQQPTQTVPPQGWQQQPSQPVPHVPAQPSPGEFDQAQAPAQPVAQSAAQPAPPPAQQNTAGRFGGGGKVEPPKKKAGKPAPEA